MFRKIIKMPFLLLIILIICPLKVSGATVSSINTYTNLAKANRFNGAAMVSRTTEDGYDILYNQGFNSSEGSMTFNDQTVFNIGSVSKVVTAISVLKLQEQGKLNIKDSVRKYLPEAPASFQPMTVEMLLTHSSGINVIESDEALSKKEVLDMIYKAPLGYPPGDDYYYSNSGYTVLAAIIEAASDTDFKTYLRQNIFEPLDLKSTGFPGDEFLDENKAAIGVDDGVVTGKVTSYPSGWNSIGYSDVLSTTRELTTIFQATFNYKLLTPDSIKLMLTPQFEIQGGLFRGIGVIIRKLPNGQIEAFHSGVWFGGNTYFSYRPADKILNVDMTNNVGIGSQTYPAIEAGTEFGTKYPLNSLAQATVLENVVVQVLNTEELSKIKNELSSAPAKFDLKVLAIIAWICLACYLLFRQCRRIYRIISN